MALQPNFGPSLPCWAFLTIAFLHGWIVSPAPKSNLEDLASVFVPPETGWPSYAPRHWVHILVAFYDMHGLQWDYSLIPVTTRDYTLYNYNFNFSSYVATCTDSDSCTSLKNTGSDVRPTIIITASSIKHQHHYGKISFNYAGRQSALSTIIAVNRNLYDCARIKLMDHTQGR
jgi:hypothetical protein